MSSIREYPLRSFIVLFSLITFLKSITLFLSSIWLYIYFHFSKKKLKQKFVFWVEFGSFQKPPFSLIVTCVKLKNANCISHYYLKRKNIENYSSAMRYF